MTYPVTLPRMVRIKAGSFPVAGSQLYKSQPNRDRVIISRDFEIGKFPVTVAEYRAFAPTVGGRDDHPVVNVTRKDRTDYVNWLNLTTVARKGEEFYLPTAAEWEYVARGEAGRIFPWGNEWNPNALNWNRDGQPRLRISTSSVSAHPLGATPEGVFDLAGNVFEAASSWYHSYRESDTVDPLGELGVFIEARGGGAFQSKESDFYAVNRYGFAPAGYDGFEGFRLAKMVR